ncbi:hypothetical protein QBC39DRAFT_346991 [Podospora conica]|nr:hypothetical protein QBC39DRAFT_346991 [Schizothecium conicum]
MSKTPTNKSAPAPLPLRNAFIIDPPVGPYPYSGLQVFGYVVIGFFTTLSLVVCGLRVHSRRLVKGLYIDDWLILVAMALTIAQSVFTGFVLHSGYWGVHDADIPPGNPPNTGMFWIFINGIVYNPLLALVKISALLFLLRLIGRGTLRAACQALIVFNVVQLVTFLSIALLQCVPLEAPWTLSRSARCIRRDVYSTALAVTNIVTDILTLLVPYCLFLGLKMNRRARMALLSVFMLGIIVTIISAVRLYYIVILYYYPPGPDKHYALGYITSSVEINLAIVTASAPALWPLARRWFPGVFERIGINRERGIHLYPDIEVAYATPRSTESQGSGGRMLRGKVTWHQRQRDPTGAIDAAVVVQGTGG